MKRRCNSRSVRFAYLFLLLVLAVENFALDPKTAIDKYIHRQWSVKDGLPHDSVTCFAQDPRGFIWVGTDNGLARFDGDDFKIFNKNNTKEIKNNSITSLYAAADGTLLIGTDGGGISIFKNNRFKHYSTSNGLPSNFIRFITGDSSQNIRVSTCGGGVIGLRLRRFNIAVAYKDVDPSLLAGCVRPVLSDSKKDLWTGTDNGLKRSHQGKSFMYTVKAGLKDNRIRAICEDREGKLWVGTEKGVNRITKTRGDSVLITNITAFEQHVVYSILEDKDGVIWTATDRGLYRVRNNGRYEIEKATSLEAFLGTIPVTSLFEDRQGILWIGTYGKGMSSLRDGKFKFYTTSDGLSHNYVTSIYQDDKGTVWIGTNGWGLNQLKQEKIKVFTKKNGLCSNYITAIYEDKRGNHCIWIGTPDGLNRWNNQQFNLYNVKDGLSHNSISALSGDREGNLWIGTHRGLNGYKNGKFYVPGNQKGLANQVILTMAGDTKGNLWIGTSQGFYRLKNTRTKPLLERISTHVVQDIYIDWTGSIWLGTKDQGLIRFIDGRFIAYPLDSEFSNAKVYRVLEDREANLWMSSNHGLFMVSKAAFTRDRFRYRRRLTSSDRYHHLLESDGLKSEVFSGDGQPAGWQTTDGRMWFPTINGIAVITPEGIKFKDPVLPVHIEKLVVDDQTFFPGGPSLFPKKTRKIEFYFTALNFDGLENLEFKCKLTGIFPEKLGTRQEIVNQKKIIFRDILPGKYNFSVFAGNENKGWGEAASYDFTVRYTISGIEGFILVLIFVLPILLVVISRHLERRAKTKEMLKIFQDDARYKTHVLTPKTVKKHMLRLLSVMKEEKPYLDPNMTVTKLANRLGVSKEHISQTINQCFYMNFNQFLNKYRIEEAKERLKDPKESQYVVFKIALDVGFNSKSTFNTAFKKFTGMNPSQYREKYLGETSSES
jgi:ligand-binding sensor domain-containing protein/AraC-like DNA-binding protein